MAKERVMWPFKCKQCVYFEKQFNNARNRWWRVNKELYLLEKLAQAKWTPIADGYPPLHTNLLVANKDFTYFGFLYLTDGWDNTKRITLYNKDEAHLTYTHPDHIAYWLNIDAFKKDQYEPEPTQLSVQIVTGKRV